MCYGPHTFNRSFEEEKRALMSTEITHPEENPQVISESTRSNVEDYKMNWNSLGMWVCHEAC